MREIEGGNIAGFEKIRDIVTGGDNIERRKMRVEKQKEEKKQAGQTREIKVGTVWEDEKQGMKGTQFFQTAI